MPNSGRNPDPGRPPSGNRSDAASNAATAGRNRLEATGELLRRVRGGDDRARDRLFERYLPVLQRWARGRVPGSARNIAETDDLVQVTLIRALRRVDVFEPRREGAFLAYLRKIFLNAIREEIRRGARWMHEPLPDALPAEEGADRERQTKTLEQYERGLGVLSERQREAVILRLEFGYSYPQIAEAVECSSANAARMIVNRAVVRIARAMSEAQAEPR